MSILLLGSTGRVGRYLATALGPTLMMPRAHLTTERDVRVLVASQPTWVVNAACWHDARGTELDPTPAWFVNATLPFWLASACAAQGVRLLHLSTNYVFGGDARPGPFGEDDPLTPISAYGVTKAAGESLVRAACPDAVIVRTSAVFGAGGGDFIAKLRAQTTARAVWDHVTVPTYAGDLAAFVRDLIRDDVPGGVYHGVNEGTATWYEYAQEIQRRTGQPKTITPVHYADYPDVPRPAHAVLVNTKRRPMRPWQDALLDFLT